MKLLPIVSLHNQQTGAKKTQNLSGESCYLDITLNFHNYFTRKCVAAKGEDEQSDLGS